MGWWYFAIALGFVALAIDHALMRDKIWRIGIRVVIAGGFGFLAWMELRNQRR
jgi:nitrate reductase NapE component